MIPAGQVQHVAYLGAAPDILGVMDVPREKTSSYGIVDIDDSSLPIRERAGVGGG